MKRKIFLSAAVAVLMIPAFASTAVTTPPSTSEASSLSYAQRQFEARSSLADGTPISIVIVASASEEGRAYSAISAASGRAQAFSRELFAEGGVEEKVNSLPAGEALELPAESFAMISKAVDISAVTGGWYDITGPSASSWFIKRDWRRIHMDPETRTITFKSEDMKLDLRRISLGYAADLAMDSINRSGFANAKVDVGSVSRIAGRDIFTPWSIQVNFGGAENPGEGALAHRALNYNLTNIAAATVTGAGLGAGLTDPKNKKAVSTDKLRSITVLAADATTATAYALASWTLGPRIGMRFVETHPEVKGVLVDNTGKLAASIGLAAATPSPEVNSDMPVQEDLVVEDEFLRRDGGSNDLKQKAREEEKDM